MKVKSLSRVRLFATPWTAAYQAPPSMGFSRQEHWSGVPLDNQEAGFCCVRRKQVSLLRSNGMPHLSSEILWAVASLLRSVLVSESVNLLTDPPTRFAVLLCLLMSGLMFPLVFGLNSGLNFKISSLTLVIVCVFSRCYFCMASLIPD